MIKKSCLTALALLCAALLFSCTEELPSDTERMSASPSTVQTDAPREEQSAPSSEKQTEEQEVTAAVTSDEPAIHASADTELSDDDIALIAHLVSCEAGDHPYMTQVCFAAMILNRLDDSGFPSTVRGIILDGGDFDSVRSGQVTGTLPAGHTVRKRYQIALKAVKEAIDGRDPTGGALYYSADGGGTLSYECGGMYFGT